MSTVTLKFPFEFEGKTIASLTFRRPKVKDIEAIQTTIDTSGELTSVIVAVARLTGLSEEAVREIDSDDLGQIAETLGSFLSRTTPSGLPGLSGAPLPQT